MSNDRININKNNYNYLLSAVFAGILVYFFCSNIFIFNSVIYPLAPLIIFVLLSLTLIFRILYLNNMYKKDNHPIFIINQTNHLLRIDIIKIASFIAPIIGLLFNKLYFTLGFNQFAVVLMFVMFALLVLASDLFIKWGIKFYIAVLLIDEVLRDFSINFVNISKKIVNNINCGCDLAKKRMQGNAGFYSYKSFNQFTKINLINRRFSTKANDTSNNNIINMVIISPINTLPLSIPLSLSTFLIPSIFLIILFTL